MPKANVSSANVSSRPIGNLKKDEAQDGPKKVVRRVFHDRVNRDLGGVLHKLRKISGTTQIEAARIVGVHQTALSRIESNQQRLTPAQVDALCDYFEIRVEQVFSGRINYWQVAKEFGRDLPIPERYITDPYSNLREIRPGLDFAATMRGAGFLKQLVRSLDVDLEYLAAPDQPIGTNFYVDFLKALINKGVLTNSSFPRLVERTRTEEAHDMFDPIYRAQASSVDLLRLYVLHQRYYGRNFEFELIETTRNTLDLAVRPAKHMGHIDYKDDVLGDFFCRFRKESMIQFPRYIGDKPVRLKERECHFHGAKKCVYQMKTA